MKNDPMRFSGWTGRNLKRYLFRLIDPFDFAEPDTSGPKAARMDTCLALELGPEIQSKKPAVRYSIGR